MTPHVETVLALLLVAYALLCVGVWKWGDR